MTDATHHPVVLHLLYFGYEATVVDSQVVAPARRIAADGFPVEFLFFEKPGVLLNSVSRLVQEDKRKRIGLPSWVLPRYPRNVFGANARALRSFLTNRGLRARPLVLHARGCQAAALALSVRASFPLLRVITDVRGDEADEYRFVATRAESRPLGVVQRWWLRRIQEMQREAIRNADAVFSVSRAMVDALPGLAARKAEGRWLLVPCVTDVDRFSAAVAAREARRAEMNLSERRVVVFMGGREPWQSLDTSARVFAACRAQDPRAFLLALTTETEAMTRCLRAVGVAPEDFRVLRAAVDEVPGFLAAGDVALLLRSAAPLNRVAFPTKFAEFLAAGLSVLATDAIEDVAAITHEEGVGAVVSSRADVDGIASRLLIALNGAFPAAERIARATAVARRRLDWAVFLPEIKKWYLELACEASSRETQSREPFSSVQRLPK